MSKKKKLIERIKTKPKDFTFEELVTLLGCFGYELENGGKTSGSRVRFIKNNCNAFTTHKPHSHKCLLEYQVKSIIEFLKEEELL